MAFIFLLGSCARISKRIDPDKRLLRSQKISGAKVLSPEVYREVLDEQPNRRIFGTTPYLSAYLSGKKRFKPDAVARKKAEVLSRYDQKISLETDSLKRRSLENQKISKADHYDMVLREGNTLMRVIGEPPVYLDTLKAEANRMRILNKAYRKGLFHAQAKTSTTSIGKSWVKVKYQIDEGRRSVVDAIVFESGQASLDSVLLSLKSGLALQQGMFYDEDLLLADRDYIEKTLKNSGYFRFRKQYIKVTLDTFNTEPFLLDIYYRIETPDQDSLHRKFDIRNVYFTTDFDPQRPALRRTIKQESGILYQYEKRRYSEKLLSTKVPIRPGQLYSLDRVQATQRNLNNLDAFRFVNVFYNDTASQGLLSYIQTSSLPRFETSEEVGIGVSQGLPGPFGSLGFKARNLFRGFEVLDMNIRASVEGQAAFTSDLQSYANYSTEVIGTLGLTFPHLVLPGPLRYKLSRYNAKTRMLVSYNYNIRPEFQRSNLKAAMVYTIQPTPRSVLNFSILDLTLVNTTRKTEAFRDFLDTLQERGNPLIFSFNRSIISSIKLDFVYNTFNPMLYRKGVYVRVFAESGGTMLNLLSDEFLSSNDTIFGLEFYRFYKLQADARYYQPITRSSLLAMRICGGYASPYGQDRLLADGTVRPNVLPYEKFFFTGGSASNRAWRPRRLGPGGFTPEQLSDGSFNYNFEQPGEVLLEANAELRVKVFRLIALAFFVDASNVWMIRADRSRPRARFQPDLFLDQMAIGAGLGLRLDFSFLLFRIDIGTKVKDPALPAGERWIGDQVNWRRPFGVRGQSNVNIGIGYPF